MTGPRSPVLDLHALGLAHPELHALLLETCSGRLALATTLLSGIAAIAAERAVAAERERVEAHLILGEAAGLRGLSVAITAVRSGIGLEQHLLDHYRRAAAEAHAPAKLRLVSALQTEDAC